MKKSEFRIKHVGNYFLVERMITYKERRHIFAKRESFHYWDVVNNMGEGITPALNRGIGPTAIHFKKKKKAEKFILGLMKPNKYYYFDDDPNPNELTEGKTKSNIKNFRGLKKKCPPPPPISRTIDNYKRQYELRHLYIILHQKV